MDFNAAVDYINSFINFEKIPKYQYLTAFKLERMNAILEELGKPHEDLRVIHVAGSKGKGSTCAITACILKESGYKVGLYTSPHLMDFRERIRILDKGQETMDKRQGTRDRGQDVFEGMIGEGDLGEIVDKIKPIAEKFRDHETLGKLSFFEIVTACAFLYFKKRKVDVAVLETGLGGRLDATNVAMPLISGITNISLEHTDKLGDTLAKIAREKAGIIKDEREVISASQEKEVSMVIRKTCARRNAKLYEVGRDIKYSILNSNEKSQIFDLSGPGYHYESLEMNLIGAHQVENASIAISMLKLMGSDKFNIKENAIRKGLKNSLWPGRLQVIQKNPYIVLDGAHNLASAKLLVNSVKRLFSYDKLICIFGMSSDKDIKGVSSILDRMSDIIILTKAKDNPRGEAVSRLKQNFRNSRPGLEESGDINEAMQKALSLADKGDLILVTGSLFIVGDAIKYLKSTR